MSDRIRYRLNDIVDAIDQIELLLDGMTFETLSSNRVVKAAFERFLEIASEASRHVPETLRLKEPGIPWRSVADIGNHLRHSYNRVDAEIIWRIYEDGQLSYLKAAVIRLLSEMNSSPQ
jgi:uncharacterized protein with HEPN domain